MFEQSQEFIKWSKRFSGCNGGDLGNPDRKSIWVCGIEHGGESNVKSLEKQIKNSDSEIPNGWDDSDAIHNMVNEPWEVNLKQRFFISVIKLLTVIDGKPLEDFKSFAQIAKPFVNGSTGYFSMNLLPINFHNLDHGNWTEDHFKVTHFSSKKEYVKWMEINRFPVIRTWVEKHQPKIIVCIGKTQKKHFLSAFSGKSECRTHDTTLNQVFTFKDKTTDTLIVVIPFMNGKPDAYIQEVGELIRIMSVES